MIVLKIWLIIGYDQIWVTTDLERRMSFVATARTPGATLRGDFPKAVSGNLRHLLSKFVINFLAPNPNINMNNATDGIENNTIAFHNSKFKDIKVAYSPNT